ncbi:AMP-binding protein [Planctomonas deserti]|uniref:AMP-binding protein n=1 Tax=Planctomonas deserti TaxID=2144185 RepID=UPI000D37B660|nr:AMP-binding protein [Planctomonas deserti]
MRPLRVLPGADPLDLLLQLREALSGTGPALLPRPAGAAEPEGAPALPAEVAKTLALVIETSGSTGSPKRVALGAGALLAGAAATQSALGGAGQWLLALPTHYIAGAQVLVRSITAEVDPLVLPPGHFDPTTFVDAIGGFRPQVPRFTALVPTQLHRLVQHAAEDARARAELRTLDAVLVGGQATAPALLDRAAGLGIRVVTTYGSSETAGGCVYDGQPVGTTRVAVVDGEIQIAGPTLADGYLGDPEATDRAFVQHDGLRWYRTGDAGEVTDGTLTVTGRLDSVLISGGEKVSLDRIELVARGIPGLADAVAVRADDEEWGQRAVLFTESVPDDATRGELKRALSESLGRVAGRAALVPGVAIPLLASGKPDRVALARRAAGIGRE